MTPSGRVDETIEIGDAERERLVQRYGRKFAAGETLFRENEIAGDAFLLQDGRVRLIRRVRHVERSLMVLKPGDLFGESALLDAAARNSTAVALTDGVALALDRATFRSMLVNYPAVAIRVMEQLVRRVRDAEDQIEILMLRDGQYKIVSTLLKLAVRSAPTESSAAIELAVSPVELASRVGLDVDTVKRDVQRLRDQGYVRITGERIELPDLEALQRLYALLSAKDELRGE
ncbi:MAG TPA: Crp/Fnr family transcriptional regulator [Polyangiaceae bacterium]|nr:Crp/Fnr family transcriptional regulator [Polyangiaceae bacterium]